MSDDLKYPIGNFSKPQAFGPEDVRGWIETIKALPDSLGNAVEGLDEGQFDTEYRPGGWTVRQVVHHVADSHLNAYCRFKLALTENAPTIKPYDEAAWADLPDSSISPSISLGLVDGLHRRFTALLEGMSEEDFARKLVHPETGEWTLSEMLALYAWHSRHHTAHITSLRERMGW